MSHGKLPLRQQSCQLPGLHIRVNRVAMNQCRAPTLRLSSTMASPSGKWRVIAFTATEAPSP